MSLKQKLSEKQSKLIGCFYVIKKIIFFVCMYKMVDINKETYNNNEIEVIVDGIGTLWLNEKRNI